MYLQVSHQPLPREEVNQIHHDCKCMGLLIGRGGLFSQVRKRLVFTCQFRKASPNVPVLVPFLGACERGTQFHFV